MGARVWGVHVGWDDPALAGHVLLRHTATSKSGYPEIGRLLRSSEHIGRGTGTLCALAMLHCAVELEGGLGITSETLLVNAPARTSLHNMGGIEVARRTSPVVYGNNGDSTVITQWMVGVADANHLHLKTFPDLLDSDLDSATQRLDKAMQRIERIRVS